MISSLDTLSFLLCKRALLQQASIAATGIYCCNRHLLLQQASIAATGIYRKDNVAASYEHRLQR